MKIRIEGKAVATLQRERIQLYCNKLITLRVIRPKLLKYLRIRGFKLHGRYGRYKGYFDFQTIHVFRSKEIGMKNYRDDGAGKRGFFRADQVAIHELMHAVWTFGNLDDGFKQAVLALHARCGPGKYMVYGEAERWPTEWFCDQFPRALLFPETCYPEFREFLRKEWFSGKFPDIRCDKGMMGRKRRKKR